MFLSGLMTLVAVAVRADASIDARTRELALRIVSRLGDAPFGLNEDAWRIVADRPDASHAQLELAATMAQRARELEPDIPKFQRTLGCALYRLGRCREALDTLREADRANESYAVPYPRAHGWVFMAMCLHELGRLPVQLIWGANDNWQVVDWAHRLNAAIPGSKLRILEHCGHLAPEDQPEKVSQLVIDHVADNRS